MTRTGRTAILPGMNPIWPTWLKFSYAVACIVTTAAVLMAFAVFAVRPLTEWFGDKIHGMPPALLLACLAGAFCALVWLGRISLRRDQKADRSIR